MKTIFLLLFISLFMVNLSAQTNYYSQDKTFFMKKDILTNVT